jgi:hypothetical protein
MFSYHFLQVPIAIFFAFTSFAFTTSKMSEVFGSMEVLKTIKDLIAQSKVHKNVIELEEEKLKNYLPSSQENRDIWAYIYKNRQELEICSDSQTGLFAKEFEKNKNRRLNLFRLGKDKFFVQISCFWAIYQGNFEFFTYEKSGDVVILNRLILKRFGKKEDGLLIESNEKSVAGIPKFDPVNQTLRLYASAGSVSCGSYLAKYQYEDDNLKLLTLRQDYDCSPTRKKPSSPENYPLIYP